MQKPSKYFGKISNKGIQYITDESLNKSYLENSYLKSMQTDYFNFSNPEYLREENSKDILSFYVKDKLNYTNNFNVNTFICQSFINLVKSFSTISQGSLIKHYNIENVNTTDITGSNNIVCETKDSLDLDFFNYISESTMFFDDENFLQNEIKNSDNSSLKQTLLNDFNSSLNSNNLVYEVNSNNFQTSSANNLSIQNGFDLESLSNLNLETSENEFTKENILKINSKRRLKIYENF